MGEFVYRILGPIEVEHDGVRIPIEAPRQRAVLATLLLDANRVVSVDRLAVQLWGESPPSSARNTIQSLVLRLRRSIAGAPASGRGDVLVTRRPGYLLCVKPGQLDLHLFDGLVRHGRRSLAAGNPRIAAMQLRQALAMWRGDPFEDAAGVRLREIDASRLREQRLAALEDRIEADLALQRHREVTAELPALIADHPLRERLHGQLMLALYRAGRQGESLEVYRLLRDRLVTDLAIEPTPALRQLHRAILGHDPRLAAPLSCHPSPG